MGTAREVEIIARGRSMPTVNISVDLPSWIYKPLRGIKRVLLTRTPKALVNIWGDRDIEYSFIIANLPAGPGQALDFGSGASNLGLMAARRGFKTLAVDLEAQTLYWKHPDVRFLKADLLSAHLPENCFDLVMNCSAIEHVGLVGRYGVTEARLDGDLEVMDRLRSVLKPGGIMLLTIPCGRDAVFIPTHRVYGRERLPLLLRGYAIEKQEFWVKDSGNQWNISDRETALQFEPRPDMVHPVNCSYALACFVLRNPGSISTPASS
jgi:SAM-dependent methyltransferase